MAYISIIVLEIRHFKDSSSLLETQTWLSLNQVEEATLGFCSPIHSKRDESVGGKESLNSRPKIDDFRK